MRWRDLGGGRQRLWWRARDGRHAVYVVPEPVVDAERGLAAQGAPACRVRLRRVGTGTLRTANIAKQAETRAPSTHPRAVDAVARGHAL